MGNRTNVVDSCLYIESETIEKFKSWLVANKITCNEDMKDYYDSIEIRDHISYRRYEYPIILNLDGFKIIGYWCSEFKTFIKELYDIGLKGEIELTCDDGTDAIIRFDTDGLIISIRQPGEFENYKLNEV
jgi:hypothetical protein